MNYKELDEYIDQYGFNNTTEITDINTAMSVNKIRREKENAKSI